MAELKITPLNESQKLRLINLFDIDETIKSAKSVEIKGTIVSKFDIEYENHTESIYPNLEDYELIMNGCNVERD